MFIILAQEVLFARVPGLLRTHFVLRSEAMSDLHAGLKCDVNEDVEEQVSAKDAEELDSGKERFEVTEAAAEEHAGGGSAPLVNSAVAPVEASNSVQKSRPAHYRLPAPNRIDGALDTMRSDMFACLLLVLLNTYSVWYSACRSAQDCSKLLQQTQAS